MNRMELTHSKVNITHLEPVIPLVEPIIPLNVVKKQLHLDILKNQPLVPPNINFLKNKEINKQFRKNIKTISKIFESVYLEGVLSEENKEELETISFNLFEVERSLNKAAPLSDADRDHLLEHMKWAKKSIEEIFQLGHCLQNFYPLANQFDQTLGTINDLSFCPLYADESLLALPQIQEALAIIDRMHSLTTELPAGPAKTRITDLVNYSVKELTFFLEDWQDIAIEAIREEMQNLHKNPNGDNVQAFRKKVSEMLKELNGLPNSDNPELFNDLKKELQKARTRLSKLPKNETSMTWGDKKWIESHPVKLDNHKEWDEGTKRLIHAVLLGLQLSQQSIEIVEKLDSARIMRLLKEKSQLVTRDSPFDNQLMKIEKDGAFLGTLLADKYKFLHNPQTYETLTSKHPRVRPLLNQVLAKHGNTPPSTEQIFDIIDHFVLTESLSTFKTYEEASHSQPGGSKSASPQETTNPIATISPSVKVIVSQNNIAIKTQSTGYLEKISRAVKTVWDFFRMPSIPEKPSAKSADLSSSDKSHPLTNQSSIVKAALGDPGAARLHTFVKSNQDEINPNLYAHLIGHGSPAILDSQVEGVKLEGTYHILTLKHQLELAKRILTLMNENPTDDNREEMLATKALFGNTELAIHFWNNKQLLDQLTLQLSIAVKIEEARSSIKEFESELRNQAKNLSAGQSFFFGGGWTSSESSHGTAIEVTMQANGKLTIRYFNTGGGLQYHSKVPDKEGKIRYLNFIELIDVPEDNFLSSASIQAIWDLKTSKVVNANAQDTYSVWLPSLGGTYTNVRYALSEAKLPQYANICAMESIMAVIEKTLTHDPAGRYYRFLSMLDGTVRYFESFKDKFHSEEHRSLMADGIKTLSFQTRAVIDDGTLSGKELAYVTALINEIDLTLRNAEQTSAIKLHESAPLTNFSISFNPIQDLKLTDYFPYENKNTEITLSSSPHLFINTKEWSPHPSTLAVDIKRFVESIHVINHANRNYLETQRSIREIIRKIPLDDPQFWEQMDAESAENLLKNLSELNKEYLWSFFNSIKDTGDRKLFSDDFLTQWKILTLSDLLLQSFPNKLDMKIPSLFQNSFLNLISRNDWHIDYRSHLKERINLRVQPSHEWAKEYKHIRRYWLKNKKSFSDVALKMELFNFKNYPAGHNGFFSRRIEENEDYAYWEKNRRESTPPPPEKVDWRGSKGSAELAFLADWAQRNPDKVGEIDSSLMNLPLNEQALELLQRMDQLPPLRDAFINSYIFDFFLTGSLNDPYGDLTTEYDFSKGLGINIKTHTASFRVREDEEIVDKKATYTELSYTLFGKSPRIAYNEEKVGVSSYFDEGKVHLRNPQRVSPGNYLKSAQTLPDSYFKQIITNEDTGSRIRLNPNISIFAKTKAGIIPWTYSKEISVEHLRELLDLSASPGLQILKTLNYFAANSHLLSSPHYQTFFRLLMTEETLLSDWLIENPSFSADLANLCEKIHTQAIEAGDMNTAIYILGMNHRFKTLTEAVDNTAKFINSRQALNQILKSGKLTNEQRALAHRERALLYATADDLIAEEAAEVLQSIVYLHLFPLPKEYKNEIDLLHITNHLIHSRFQKTFERLLTGNDRDIILTQAQQIIFPNTPTGVWTSPTGFPVYLSPDGALSVDVLEGSLKPQGTTIMPFNNFLMTEFKIKRVFENSNPKVQISLGGDDIQLIDDAGNNYRRIIHFDEKQNQVYILQRQFEGKWFQLQPENINSAINNHALKNSHNIWAGPIEDGKIELLFTDANHQINYRAIVADNILQKISKTNNGIPNGLEFVDPKSPAMQPFYRIENSEFIQGWSRAGELESIELPRFGLSFHMKNIDGTLQAFCEQLPGYALMEGNTQHVFELSNFSHYLHLKKFSTDGKASEVVIIPRQFVKSYTRGSYLTETELDRQLDVTQPGSQKYFEYVVEPNGLKPKSNSEEEAIEANLFLAMIQLSEKHAFNLEAPGQSKYTLAHKYLKLVDQQALRSRRGLSLDAIQILSQIVSLNKKTKDSHPDAIAVQLRAAFLLQRNHLDHKTDKEFEALQNIEELMKTYNLHENHVDRELKLSPLEKKILEAEISIKPIPGNEITSSFPPRPSNIFTLSDTKFLEGLSLSIRTIIGIPSGVLLRDIHSNLLFLQYYQIIKGEIPLEQALEIVNKGMGLALPPDTPQKKLIHEMTIALRLFELSKKSRLVVENELSTILLALITEPDLFPSGEKLAETIHAWEEAKDRCKLIKKQISDIDYQFNYGKRDRAKHQSNLKYFQEEVENLKKEGKAETNPEVLHYKESISILKKNLDNIDKLEQELVDKKKELTETSAKENSLKNELLVIYKTSEQLAENTGLGLYPKHQTQTTKSKRLIESKNSSEKPKAQDLAFVSSINLKNLPPSPTHSLQKAIVRGSVIKKIFIKRPLNPLQVKLAQDLFAVNSDDSSVNAAFEEASHDLENYIKKDKGTPVAYDIANTEELNTICLEAKRELADRRQDVEVRASQLLALANSPPRNLGKKGKLQIEMLTGNAKLISLDELIRAYYKRDYLTLHEMNPELSKEEITLLFANIREFLLESTFVTQLAKVVEEGEKLQNALKTNAPDNIKQEHIRAFLTASRSKREYDPNKRPDYLVFEYYGKILIWKEQLEKIQKMSKPHQLGALVEFAMGMGKSRVIAPLLAWMNADGIKLTALLVPDPLLNEILAELQQTLGNSSGQVVRTIAIKRQEVTLERLERLQNVLKEIIENKQILIWTAADMQSLFNQWIEMNEHAFEMSKAGTLTQEELARLAEKNTSFIKVFNTLIQSGCLTVDEIHLVFDILKTYNFTFGNPQSPLSDISSASAHLFDTILFNKNLQNIHWNFLPTSTGEGFTEESYHSFVKPRLVDALIDNNIAPEDKEFKDFFTNLSNENLENLRAYLLDQATPQGFAGYHLLANLGSESRIRREFAVIKELLSTVLPLTTNKQVNVHFGLDAAGELTVPYHEGKPVENSLFGSVLERFAYTAQLGLAEGISPNIIGREIDSLREIWKKNRENGLPTDFSEFREMTQGDPELTLDSITRNDYDKIAANVNANQKLKWKLITKYRFPTIKIFEKEIESGAHLIPLLAQKRQGVLGMSGTLYNVPTFPRVFQPAEMSDTQAKTLEILLREGPQTVLTLPTDTPITVEILHQHANISSASIIDAAGLFPSHANAEIANDMLKQFTGTAIEGIVYYDGNVKKVITIHESKPLLYSKDFDRSHLGALWDLSHITGADIPVAQDMHAIVTINKHMTLYLFEQLVWRLRQLGKGQKISLVVPDEDRKFIQACLTEGLGKKFSMDQDLSLRDFLQYCLLNQIQNEAKNNYRAIPQLIKMELVSRLLNILFDEKTPTGNIFTIYAQIRSLFINDLSKDPWEQWGMIKKDELTPKAIEILLNSWKNHLVITAIRENPDLYPGLDLESLFKEWETIIQNLQGPLPPTISLRSDYGNVVEQRTEQKTEQKTEQRTETRTEQRSSYINVPRNINLRKHIPNKNIFNSSESTPISSEEISWPPLEKHAHMSSSPCITAQTFVSKHPHLNKLSKHLDPRLLVTLNFGPIHEGHVPFSNLQKIGNLIEIIQDKASGELKVKLLDSADSDEIAQGLIEDKKNPNPTKNKVRLALYDLNKDRLIFELQGSEEIALDSSTQEALLQLTVEAKFLQGHLKYTLEERPYLEKFLEKMGVQNALILMNTILNPDTRSDSRKYFASSPLARTMESLGASRSELTQISNSLNNSTDELEDPDEDLFE